MPLDLALFIAIDVAEALEGARSATALDGGDLCLSHLDLSAREVLLSFRGVVKVADFGIARAMRGTSVRSMRALAARVATLAPEVARGYDGDARSDVFSLGIVLHEMLIGPRFPLPLSEARALEHARDGHVPPTLTELQLPKEVRTILARALAVEPSRRFPHAAALAYELRRVALSMGVGDGRIFLRKALEAEEARARNAGPESGVVLMDDENDPTDEIPAVTAEPRAERTCGMMRKAPPSPESDED
jgi:serine/threonine-protein kinase